MATRAIRVPGTSETVADRWKTELSYGGSDNNGNVRTQTISAPRSDASMWTAQQSYDYDGLNRLQLASEPGGFSRTFDYDAYGNGWVASATGITPGSFVPINESWYDGSNRLAGLPYDNAGNLTQVGAHAYSYDGENRLKKVTIDGSPAREYDYDGEGHRVRMTAAAETTVYVYDAFGQLAAEHSTQAPPQGGTRYLTADHLGSTRVETDAAGTVQARYDYLPFGEEIPAAINSRTSVAGYAAATALTLKFTGKERDGETGLDYFGARYFSAAQGRFTTPDWSAKPQPVPYADLRNPQSLNLYAYVRNNPLTNRDPDGHWCLAGIGTTCDKNIPPPPKPPAPPALQTQDMLRLSRQPRTMSAAGDAFLKHHEGKPGTAEPVLKSYPDIYGNLTIGWGHLERSDTERTITLTTAETLYGSDRGAAEKFVNRTLQLWVPVPMFEALTSVAFNSPRASLQLIRLLNSGASLSRQNFLDTLRSPDPGLINRRTDEAALAEVQ